jgi:hypothetical protein
MFQTFSQRLTYVILLLRLMQKASVLESKVHFRLLIFIAPGVIELAEGGD